MAAKWAATGCVEVRTTGGGNMKMDRCTKRFHFIIQRPTPKLSLKLQMVELRETGNIMADMARMMITSGANGQKVNGGSALINAGQKKPPELKATLYTWRERLPNKWDALKDWDDIFCWRTEVGVRESSRILVLQSSRSHLCRTDRVWYSTSGVAVLSVS